VDSDFQFEEHEGTAEERVQSLVDQAIGQAARIGFKGGSNAFDELLDLGQQLTAAIAEIVEVSA
jgi:hypothetical protein